MFRSDRRHPSAQLLRDLHWLPLESRIVFKLLLLIYKGINGLLPSYLAEFLIPYVPSRPNMRSASRFLIVTPRTKRRPTLGDKAFAAVAPRLWNSLPIHIRHCSSTTSFKRALKTHLFPVSKCSPASRLLILVLNFGVFIMCNLRLFLCIICLR